MSLETNIPQLNQSMPIDGQYSAVLAYLSQLALSKPAELFSNVVALIAHSLPADVVWLWELDAGHQQLTLKASSRWENGSRAESQLPIEHESLEEFVLRSSQPILVQDLNTDARFNRSSFLQTSGVTGGLAVTVGTVQKPYGIFQAFSAKPHTYSQNDIHFFHSVANILALVLDARQNEVLRREGQIRRQVLQAQSAVRLDPMGRDQYEIKNRLVDGHELERLRLAQELHDVPIQDMYGIMYQMDDLKDIIKDTHGMEILEEFNSTVHRVVNNLRSICGELRPPSLSPFGLEVAIRDHVEKLHSLNPELKINLDLMHDQQILSDSIRLRLFRIYQQAINNVVRHAQASEVNIRFRWDDEVIMLEVEDNGIGFKMPESWVDLVRQEHFGLVGIAERAESMEGNLEIVSAPDTGTTVRVSVPRR